MSVLPHGPRVAAWLTAAVLTVAAPTAASNDANYTTYEELIARLSNYPSTREADARVEAATARAEQASALPNPSIAYNYDSAFGSGAYRGTGSAETSLVIKQPLELFGQRRTRIQVASAESDSAALKREQTYWEMAGRLALAYAQAEAAQRRLELAREALALIERDAQGMSAMVEQGREPGLRIIQAQADVAFAAATVEEAQALKDEAFARLSALALRVVPLEGLGGSLLDREPRLQEHTGQPLSIRLAEAEREVSAGRTLVERRRARPDITVSIGRQQFRESRDDAYMFGLELTVPLLDRNRGGIRAAVAEERAAEARLDAEKHASHAERIAATSSLRVSASRVRAADAGVAAAQEAYRLARIGFDAGRLSELELRSTRAAFITASQTAIDARLARVLAETALARVEGRVPFGVSP